MYSSEDLEKLWFLYKLEGQPKNLSIESFCMLQGVSYEAFYNWFSKRKKSIVPVEIVGMPVEQSSEEAVPKEDSPSQAIISKSAIENVVISLENRVEVSKKNLSYQELLLLVEKLEVLC
ncbi:hypothetical protein [uncultured Bacteroides sp.]|uniref:hypothetical protein n=1 Tax=uncultured Bacteroides sp. TaxID=162156 RepID=UPI002AA7B754|nr:hypothetical protein [uncultured Bacteroides sp.]